MFRRKFEKMANWKSQNYLEINFDATMAVAWKQ